VSQGRSFGGQFHLFWRSMPISRFWIRTIYEESQRHDWSLQEKTRLEPKVGSRRVMSEGRMRRPLAKAGENLRAGEEGAGESRDHSGQPQSSKHSTLSLHPALLFLLPPYTPHPFVDLAFFSRYLILIPTSSLLCLPSSSKYSFLFSFSGYVPNHSVFCFTPNHPKSQCLPSTELLLLSTPTMAGSRSTMLTNSPVVLAATFLRSECSSSKNRPNDRS
jgi:hypothetical protein